MKPPLRRVPVGGSPGGGPMIAVLMREGIGIAMSAGASRVFRCRSRDGRWSFEVPDGGAVVVGRSPERADVAIPNAALARRDIRFRNERGVLTVEYVDRRGSIWLNGKPLEGVSRPLVSGDEILLLSELVFVIEAVAEQP